ncbi:MAG: hypothetical protein ACRBN8_16625 [Nannocystales bacterium]
MDARWLLWLAVAPTACGDITSEVAISFERPRDDAPLSDVDNITVSLTPDGFTEQFIVEGSDAAVEFELPPDGTSRSLSVFFARGEALVAYGRTPPFTFAGAAGAGVVVFLGYPGTLATLDRDFALPDASTLITDSPGRGAIALGSDGSAVFLDAYTYALVPVAPFPEPTPASDDGVFVGDGTGSVTRISYAEQVAATRYVYGTDAWVTVSPQDMPPRPGGAAWFDAETALAYVAGGGEQTSVLQVGVAPEESTAPTITELSLELDAPRRGGTLFGRPGAGEASLIVFGGDDPSLPMVLSVTSGQTAEPSGEAWTGAQCVALDETRTLCAGGSLDGDTTQQGAIVDTADAELTVSRLPDLLPIPMRDILWLEDSSAVYAQGEGRLFRFDRGTLEREEPSGSPQRATGGGAATLATGVTVIAGGEDQDGAATEVWQLFSPEI